jgi:hypothetical protein
LIEVDVEMKNVVVVTTVGCGGVGPIQTAAEITELMQFVLVVLVTDGTNTLQMAPEERKYIELS